METTSNQFPAMVKNQSQTSSGVFQTLPYQQALNSIFILVAIRTENIPDDVEYQFLLEYIRKHLSKFKPEQFVEAFELFIQRKLDTEAKHYGNFTAEFLEEVMRTYSIYLAIKNKKKALTLPEHEISEQEKDNIMLNSCLKAFSDFKEGILILDMGSGKYDWLNDRGVIKFSLKRKNDIFRQAKEEVESELRTERLRKPIKRLAIEKMLDNMAGMDFNHLAVRKAKYKALMLFFSELNESGIELTDLLNHD